MARTKKFSASRPAKNNPIPYTDHLRKVYEFATAERTVRSGGVAETLTNVDIMVRKQFEAGVSGKTLAQRDYLQLAQFADVARGEHIRERCEYWSEVKARNQRIIDQACAAKVPIPRVLPHPDDIIVDWKDGVQIPGPMDDAEWKKFDETVRVRNALFLQQAMENAINGVRLHDRPTLGAAGLLGYLLNRLLPPSLRLSDFEWIERVDRLSRLSKRDALKQCRAAWRIAGARAARGKLFGTREMLLPMLDALKDLVDAGLRQKADPQGYEEALHAMVAAADEFRRSAPKLNLFKSGESYDEEGAA